MSNYVTRQTLVPARIETIQCQAATLPPTARNFIWPEYKALFEAMTPNSDKNKRQWKSFEHYKRSVTIPVLTRNVGGVANHLDVLQNGEHRYDTASSADPFAWFCNEFGSAGEPFQDLQPWYVPGVDGFGPNPDGLSDLKQRSLRSMLPLVKDELSLVNSIIELKDFKSLPATLRSMSSTVTSMLSKLNWKYMPGWTLKRMTRTSADAYLQTSFNILPLLSDIRGIYTALTKIRAEINALVAGQGYTQRKHFRATLTVPDPYTKTRGYTSPLPLGSHPPYEYGCDVPCGITSITDRYVYTDVSTFHAEIEYNYNFTQYQVEHAQLFGLLDALGVNLNPAIIWNAIPWSFVVDWVLGVSRWLNDRRILNMEPQINIHNYLWSYTARRRILMYRTVKTPSIYHDIGGVESVTTPGVPMPVTTESAYKRVVELPSSGSITSSGLSLKEFSLGAALVIVRKSHHKRS